VSTVHRWMLKGRRNRDGEIIRLDSLVVGGSRYTTREALRRLPQRSIRMGWCVQGILKWNGCWTWLAIDVRSTPSSVALRNRECWALRDEILHDTGGRTYIAWGSEY